MPLFVLSPASLAHSALFAGYYSYLSLNVVRHRVSLDKGSTPQREEALNSAVRAHGNFTEYVPLTFGLLFLAELNGAPTSWVHAAYTALFAFRVSHASLGLLLNKGSSLGRKVGFLGTLAVMLGAGLYNFKLGYEPLMSFLGIQ